jgi:simple sugar transport system ATP-binding protein
MEISTLFSVIADGRVSFPVPVGDMTIEQIGVLMGGQSNANVEEVSYVEA